MDLPASWDQQRVKAWTWKPSCESVTLPETNGYPLKIGRAPIGNFIFQPSIFRGKLAVSFREDIPQHLTCLVPCKQWPRPLVWFGIDLFWGLYYLVFCGYFNAAHASCSISGVEMSRFHDRKGGGVQWPMQQAAPQRMDGSGDLVYSDVGFAGKRWKRFH